MRDLWGHWRDEIARNPVVLLPIGCFAATVWMNAATGYALADRSIGTGVLFAMVALATAYFYSKGLAQRGLDLRKGLMLLLATVGICINLYSAFQTLGINMADGAVKRGVKAKGVAAVQRQVDDLEAERRKIGTVRAIGTIEAAVTLECEKKSRLYPDGVGPKCTELRGELAGAKRAGELDRLIKAEMKGLEAREQVAAPGADVEVVRRLAQAAGIPASAETIRFVFMLVFAVVIEVLAALGFWLVGSGHGREEPQGSFSDAPGDRLRGAHSSGAIRDGVPIDIGPARALPAAAAPLALAAPSFVAPGDSRPPGAGYAAGGAAHAAPIHINIGMPQGVPQEAGAAGVGRDQQGGTAAALPSPGSRPAPRYDLPALDADRPPADRSRITRELAPHEREAGDVMLAFRAACVIDAPGGIVALKHLYARYQHWAGERALDEAGFLALFPDVTGVALEAIGGSPHARGVALRAGATLKTVEASRAA